VARTAILAIKIISDATKAAAGLDKTAKGVSAWEKGLGKAATASTAMLAGIVGVGKAAFDQASALQQAGGAVESVFGQQADAVMNLASAAAQAVGLSKSEYAGLASVLGGQLKNLGVAQEDLVGTTDSLISAGADLAATYGGTTTQAVEALSAAFRGEYDSLEKYTVSIKQSDVNAQLAAKGQDKLTGSARTQAETQAKLALIMKQSAAAHGQFGREADTAAGQQQRAAADTKNALAELGAVLLPIISTAAKLFGQLAAYVGNNARTFQILAGVVGGLSAALIIANAAMSAYATITAVAAAVQTAASKAALGTRIQIIALTIAQKAAAVGAKLMAAAQWLLNVAMSANPIGLIIIAIVALVAGFILLYRKSETFRNAVQALGRIAVAVFNTVVNAVKVAVAWIGGKLTAAGNAVRAVLTAAGLAILSAFQQVQAIVNRVGAAFRSAGAAGRAALAAVIGVIQRVIAVAVQLANILRGTVSAAFRAVVGVARSAFNTIAATVRVVATAARNVANQVAAAFRSAFGKIAGFAHSAANAAMAPFRALEALVNRVVSAARNIHFPSPPSWLNKAIKGPSVSTAAYSGGVSAAGLLRTGGPTSAATTSRSAGTVVINISGALDPEGVARQLSTLLGSSARRRRGVVVPLRAGAA
jgi:phage-related protein